MAWILLCGRTEPSNLPLTLWPLHMFITKMFWFTSSREIYKVVEEEKGLDGEEKTPIWSDKKKKDQHREEENFHGDSSLNGFGDSYLC